MKSTLYSGIYAVLDIDRIAPRLPDDPDEDRLTVLRYAVDAAKSGAIAIQLRAKSVPAHSLWLPRMLADLRKALPEQVPVVMNDHVLPLQPLADQGGYGLHGGQGDDSPEHARVRLGENVLLGRSTHDLDQVRAANRSVADYIGFGPVLPTEGKSNADPVTGMDGLRAACELSDLPVVAIGGLGVDELAAAKQAGARCAAVIGAWLGDAGAPNGPNLARMAMADLVAAWRAAT